MVMKHNYSVCVSVSVSESVTSIFNILFIDRESEREKDDDEWKTLSRFFYVSGASDRRDVEIVIRKRMNCTCKSNGREGEKVVLLLLFGR